MKLFRRRRRRTRSWPLGYRMTLLWLVVLLALSPWLLGAVVTVLTLGSACLAAWRPGQRAHAYYRTLALVALTLTSFVDVMLALGNY